MTVDDLLEEFRNHPTTREGVKSIVRALRDEFGRIMEPSDDWNRMGVVDVFNEILGAAGQKVGTHGSPELDEDARKLEAMGQDPGMTLEELLAPATDAAPAVCEWEKEQPGIWVLACDATIFIGYEDEYKKCLSCGKRIKFTEAK